MSDNPFAAPKTTEPARKTDPDNPYSYRPAKGLVAAVKISIWIYCLAITTILVMDTIGSVTYPSFSDFDADVTDSTEQFLLLGIFGAAVIGGLAFLVAAIFTCMFMNRSNKNVRALGTTNLEFTPGWTVGVWFIPIINLFRPYSAMKELYQTSSNPDGDQWKSVEPLALLAPWWGCWLIGGMISRFVDRIEMRGTDLGMGGLIASYIAALLLIVGGILLTMILSRISDLQATASGASSTDEFYR